MKALLSVCLTLLTGAVGAQTRLVIPDTLTGSTINLDMHEDSVRLFPSGPVSHTYSFNQFHYLGPTLILQKGNHVAFNVSDHIGDTTSVHWHGLHVAAVNDGGPHTTILPNASWSPQFTVMDQASTYWYHPHMHGKTATQAIKGAAGMIIVRDSLESTLNLPRTYGVDDFPVIVQCQQFDALNQVMPRGMQDSTLIVNGARANYGTSVFADMPAQIVRIRLLNASGERTFNFGFTGNKPFQQIATDGGLFNAPVTTTRVRLSPGERAELLLDLSGMNGQTIHLMSYASELPTGVQGGPTMAMPPGNPPMDSPLNGIDFNVLTIHVAASTANPVTTVPTTLASNIPLQESQAVLTRNILMTAQSMMSMDGPFYLNGLLFDMMRIDYHIPMNNIEIWSLTNQTMVAHPFHIHGIQFYVLDRDGTVPPPNERGRKDVVLISSNETVRLIAKFEDFPDTLTPYMYHCHILMHEDDGMMGQYVIRPSTNGLQELTDAARSVEVYPNPTDGRFDVRITNSEIFNPSVINVYSEIGTLVKRFQWDTKPAAGFELGALAVGTYLLELKDKNGASTMRKIVKR